MLETARNRYQHHYPWRLHVGYLVLAICPKSYLTRGIIRAHVLGHQPTGLFPGKHLYSIMETMIISRFCPASVQRSSFFILNPDGGT